jgi:hypothetical protein
VNDARIDRQIRLTQDELADVVAASHGIPVQSMSAR